MGAGSVIWARTELRAQITHPSPLCRCRSAPKEPTGPEDALALKKQAGVRSASHRGDGSMPKRGVVPREMGAGAGVADAERTSCAAGGRLRRRCACVKAGPQARDTRVLRRK